jgi:hypothetical protein
MSCPNPLPYNKNNVLVFFSLLLTRGVTFFFHDLKVNSPAHKTETV